MQRVEFETALKRVAEFGCAENVEMSIGCSISTEMWVCRRPRLIDAVNAPLTRGYPQVALTQRRAHSAVMKASF